MITQSEQIDAIIPALIMARKAVRAATKNKENPFYKTKYVDLSEIIECSLQSILENDLFLSQHPIVEDGIDFLKTQISHSTGQFMCSYTKIINGKPNDPQAQGSAITYARRYGYEALLNIQRADDDGQGAMPTADEAKPQQQPAKQPQETPNLKTVSKAQAGLLFHKFKDAGFDDADREAWLIDRYSVKTTYELPMTAVKEILTLHESGELKMLSNHGGSDDLPF